MVIHVLSPSVRDAWLGGRILSAAFTRAGRQVQTVVLRGQPGVAVGVALQVKGERADARHTSLAIVLDPALLAGLMPAALAQTELVVVNAPSAPCRRLPGATRVVAIDAEAVAGRAGAGVIAVVLGAFAGATGLIALDHLLPAVEATCPTATRANVAACGEGYVEVADDLDG
jgi:Pyruvate/2-oxoacid:ferredoxin oxidoreductase gamma subunit